MKKAIVITCHYCLTFIFHINLKFELCYFNKYYGKTEQKKSKDKKHFTQIENRKCFENYFSHARSLRLNDVKSNII